MEILDWDDNKSDLLKRKRGLNLLEAADVLKTEQYVLIQKNDDPEQWLAIGYAKNKLISLVYEDRVRNDQNIIWLVTYWESSTREREIYEKKINYR